MSQALKFKITACARKFARPFAFIGGFFYAIAIISLILKHELVSTIMALVATIFFSSKNIADFLDPPGKSTSDMTHEELLELICNSDPLNDWVSLRDTDKSMVVYKNDHRLRFSNNDGEEGLQNRDFKAPWANCFPDPYAYGLFYKLSYDGGLIKLFTLVSVDGGRCLLPWPENEGTLKVDRLDYLVALILNAKKWDTNWQFNFNETMSQAKLTLKE